MILKKIAGISFALAFLMAIVLFTGTGREYISIGLAKTIFMIAGAIGLLLNLLSFQTGINNSLFSFLYWSGSIILFIGLTFLLMNWPYGFYIIVTGLAVLGVSFILPERLIAPKEDNTDILDQSDE